MTGKLIIAAILLAVVGLSSCAPFLRFYSPDVSVSKGTQAAKGNKLTDEVYYGEASYYADKFHGRQTANGEIFDNGKMTAAHKTLPFGTKVRVTNVSNGKSVEVRINDRGPFVKGRIIDLSRAAAEELGMIHSGVAKVEVEIIGR